MYINPARMLREHLIQAISWAVFVVASAFIIWGQADIKYIIELLVLFVLLRGVRLFSQWRQRPLSEEEKQGLAAALAREMLDAREAGRRAEGHAEAGHGALRGLDAVLSSPEYARRLEARYARHAPRARGDILSEAACLLVAAPSVFFMVLMLTQNIVTISGTTRWSMGVALAVAAAVYFILNVIHDRNAALGIRLRWLAAATAFVVTGVTVCARHPYLLESGAERRRQMAERVWSMEFSVEACRHADVLFACAKDLAAAGRGSDAALLFERGLLMEPHDFRARQMLISLYEQMGRGDDAARHQRMLTRRDRSSDRLFVPFEAVRPLPELAVRQHAGFVLCLVPVGEVPDVLLNRAGAEAAARLGVPVARYPKKIQLGAADRFNGVGGGGQWLADSLFGAFSKQGAPFPSGACQFILVTAADIYMGAANFVFGGGGGGHGCVSYHRFRNTDGPPEDDIVLIDRLAKQICSSSIKAFGIASTDPNCVTVYSHSLSEFDLKAQTPAPETEQRYREAIRRLEQGR